MQRLDSRTVIVPDQLGEVLVLCQRDCSQAAPLVGLHMEALRRHDDQALVAQLARVHAPLRLPRLLGCGLPWPSNNNSDKVDPCPNNKSSLPEVNVNGRMGLRL